MDLADCSLRRSSSGDSVCVDPGLNLYVRPGFELPVSFGKILAVVATQSPFDIDRMRIVAFDEVAVVAVHRPYQVGDGGHDPRREAAPKCG